MAMSTIFAHAACYFRESAVRQIGKPKTFQQFENIALSRRPFASPGINESACVPCRDRHRQFSAL